VGIDDIGRRTLRQQESDGGGIRSVERNEVRASLSNEPREPRLPGRVADGLSQRRGWDGDPHPPYLFIVE
jgi:hypothetical protein